VRGETQQQVFVAGGVALQRLVIRRVALYPLRSGALTVDPMSVEAQIMKRVDIGNPFGLFEGTVVDVHRRSSALTIDARPVPPGLPVAAGRRRLAAVSDAGAEKRRTGVDRCGHERRGRTFARHLRRPLPRRWKEARRSRKAA